MAKSAIIRARIEPELKVEAETIFNELGLSITEAITLFYRQIKLRRGLPFEVRIPNRTTLQTFKDTDEGKNLIESENADDLFSKLGF